MGCEPQNFFSWRGKAFPASSATRTAVGPSGHERTVARRRGLGWATEGGCRQAGEVDAVRGIDRVAAQTSIISRAKASGLRASAAPLTAAERYPTRS